MPAGWAVVHAEDSRQACVDHVDAHRADLGPAQLIERS
ncbi:MbtH family NRPS accessory protein [Kitasatospora sp. NPDC094019]